MANEKSLDFIDKIKEYAEKYIQVCLDSKIEVATGSGKIVTKSERHIPTVQYFLRVWLPRNLGETISRETYYEWLKGENPIKSDTIKSIDDLFNSLAADIVANEGKGIFYAKNKLGWTDKQDLSHSGEITNRVVRVTMKKNDE